MDHNPPKFVMLVVLDGWGVAAEGPGNAIKQAETPNMDRFAASYPHTILEASGEAVGLPRGEVGNTETGHLNLGAGRIVYQDLLRINLSIADGTFYQNQALIGAIDHARTNNSNLHLMGLIGAGGVHSNIEHLYALIELAKKHEFNRVFLHVFTDGRDSPPTSAKTYIEQLKQVIAREGVGQIASIMGRYWAMDRDYRWDRTSKAYFALTKGIGNLFKTPEEAVDLSYSQGKTDEFIDPCLIAGSDGKPLSLIKDNDSVIFFNFRIDRPRQLSRAFVFEDFTKANFTAGFDPYLVKYQKSHLASSLGPPSEPFERGPRIPNLFFVSMTEYEKAIVDAGAKVAFPPEVVQLPLGRAISEAGYRQLRVAESEKERFVTFYFNGQQEIAFDGEDRLIVPSPKVATYDLMPEMSAIPMTEFLLKRLQETPDYKFILINYANADMVGHTGNIGAAVKACDVVDECLGKLSAWVIANDGVMIITGDHGNAEVMIDTATGTIDTEHNSSPVPFIVLSKTVANNPQIISSGILADVAPTVLKILGLEVPSTMTGRNLLDSQNKA
ncbi:MAG: 2,3-bisphosphoglycerate-independent phosphoglycerate mutase [Candidatus Microgenomates bacterium]|jgi:2,3-bisphosphoglycerate-independent phosphoglycerate mutase